LRRDAPFPRVTGDCGPGSIFFQFVGSAELVDGFASPNPGRPSRICLTPTRNSTSATRNTTRPKLSATASDWTRTQHFSLCGCHATEPTTRISQYTPSDTKRALPLSFSAFDRFGRVSDKQYPASFSTANPFFARSRAARDLRRRGFFPSFFFTMSSSLR
jgi:hypothetical protein